MVMLAMAVGMPDTLDYYKSNTDGMMFAKYQYVLKSYEDDDNKRIATENKDAEKFNMTSLVKRVMRSMRKFPYTESRMTVTM